MVDASAHSDNRRRVDRSAFPPDAPSPTHALNKHMILVVGATGLLGEQICRRLRAAGHPVRALVRPVSESKAASLRDLGVEVCIGDIRNDADVERACAGARAVISTATAMGSSDKGIRMRDVDQDGQTRLVNTAMHAGVGRFIYISASPNLTSVSPLIRYKRAAEAAVCAGGMRWTILQPSVFMEVWLSPILGWNVKAGKARVFGPGTAPLPWISIHNVAEYAVIALDDPRFDNRNVPLAGPTAISPNAVVHVFERVTGRKFSTSRIPLPVMALLAPVVGLFNESAASGMMMGMQASQGDPIDSPLQREIALPLTTIEDYARHVTR